MSSAHTPVIETWRPMPVPPEFDVEDAVKATKYAGIPWLDCYSGWPELYDGKVRDFVELIHDPTEPFDAQLDSYLDGNLDLVEVLDRRRHKARLEAGELACQTSVLIIQDIKSGTLEEQVRQTVTPRRSFG